MLILVRHGRTEHNATRRLLGHLDIPLDDLGLRQAQALGKETAIAGAARVVSSPLTRARQTADALGPPVSIDKRWVEVDYGTFDGMALDEVPAELWRGWRADLDWVPEGGESLAAVGRRVRAACTDLAVEARDRDLVVVSHVSPIKAAVAWALGAPEEILWRMFLDTASVCRIAVGEAGPSLHSFNEVHHRPSA